MPLCTCLITHTHTPHNTYLDEHGLKLALARVHVSLQVLVDPLEDKPQLRITVNAVLFRGTSTKMRASNHSFRCLANVNA